MPQHYGGLHRRRNLEGFQRRAKDSVNGETITVSRDMTYKQWRAKFAVAEQYGQGWYDACVAMAQNPYVIVSSTTGIKRVGSAAPSRFKDFQQVKYFDADEQLYERHNSPHTYRGGENR